MHSTPFAHGRRLIGRGLVISLFLLAAWSFVPGLPVLRAPTASAAARESGLTIFEHEWTPSDPLAGGDGLGPVFNARSCVACHFQGGVGGGGTNEHNVLAFEAVPTKQNPRLHSGLIHASAVDPTYQETMDNVRELFPIVHGGQRIVGGCSVKLADFDPVRTQHVNTPALFGDGWIDRISGKNIVQNWRRNAVAVMAREFDLDFTSIPAGRPRSLPGGRIGKFGWKAQFATLEEFVAAACANELGLGNPRLEQAKPLSHTDYSSVKADLNRKQFRELVAFVDTLPRPTQILPDDRAETNAALNGQELFRSIGCAQCHTPDIGGVKGIYSDFLLHKIEDPKTTPGYHIEEIVEVPLPDDHPLPEEWKTPPLWGVADSAPYFHDGGSRTLDQAILRHAGGATRVTEAYRRLSEPERQAILAFLKTLRAPSDAPQPTSPSPSQMFARR